MESIESVKTGFYLLLDDLGKPIPTDKPLTNELDACEAANALLRSGEAPRVIIVQVLANRTLADLPPVEEEPA